MLLPLCKSFIYIYLYLVLSAYILLYHTINKYQRDWDPRSWGVATADNVRAALLKGANESGRMTALAKNSVNITGIWPTKSGSQIATARVPRTVANAVIRIPVGWIMCRVRPRKMVQTCYRCHGYDHTSNTCIRKDLSFNCRQCGKPGQKENWCTEGDELCITCDHARKPRIPRRLGSRRCQAWKVAIEAL